MFSRMIENHLEVIVAVAILTVIVVLGGLCNSFVDGLGL